MSESIYMNLEEWVKRKIDRKAISISAAKTVNVTFAKAYGGFGRFASIVIHAEPSNEFKFTSEVVWPRHATQYNDAVLDGILDETLATSLGSLVSRIKYTLKEIGWHDIDSDPTAFYFAAKMAVVEISKYSCKNEHSQKNI
jgi:Elongation factor G, domain IV